MQSMLSTDMLASINQCVKRTVPYVWNIPSTNVVLMHVRMNPMT